MLTDPQYWIDNWQNLLVSGALLAGLYLRFRPRLKRLSQLLEDWHGTDARPGVPARPGVMVRLEALEQRTAVLEKELRPNGGGSIKDQITSMTEQLSEIGKRLGAETDSAN